LVKILNSASLAKSVVGRVGHLSAGGLNFLPLNSPPTIRITHEQNVQNNGVVYSLQSEYLVELDHPGS